MECQGRFLRIKRLPQSVGLAGLRLEQTGLHLEQAGLDCGEAGLHLGETGLHHGAVGLYLVAVQLVLFVHFTTIQKVRWTIPKTHKALYWRGFLRFRGL